MVSYFQNSLVVVVNIDVGVCYVCFNCVLCVDGETKLLEGGFSFVLVVETKLLEADFSSVFFVLVFVVVVCVVLVVCKN